MSTADGGKKGAAGKKRKAVATVRPMMYGYGDDQEPLQESVDLVEDILIDYVTTMMHNALDESSKHGKLATEDLIYLVRKDPKKYNRVRELLVANEEIKEAKKAIETNEEVEKDMAVGDEDAT